MRLSVLQIASVVACAVTVIALLTLFSLAFYGATLSGALAIVNPLWVAMIGFVAWPAFTVAALVREGRRSLWLALLALPILACVLPIATVWGFVWAACAFGGACP
jgi:hypothetical protein